MFNLFKRTPKKPDVSRIVPRIKHTEFLTSIRGLGAGEDSIPVTEPLVADLLVTYAFDLPHAFLMVTQGDVKALGMTTSELRAAAVSNLRAQIGDFHPEGEPPVLMLVTNNALEACLLLLDEIWQSLGAEIPGEIVVAVPTRDVVLATSSESAEGLEAVCGAIAEAQKDEPTHNLTRHLLVWRNGHWEVFDEKA